MRLKITHIINPVAVGESSDLYAAQPVTFESMRAAKLFAEAMDPDLIVELAATCYREDSRIVPAYFSIAGELVRSVLDFGSFPQQRRLPLLNDILSAAYALGNDTDYIVYTNVDIALMPSFYLFIASKIRQGADAMVINRRTIPRSYQRPADLPLMYAEVGSSHPGYDCFVMRRNMLPLLKLEKIIVGARKVGLALYLNLRSFASSFGEFDGVHLTFHIGDDKVWKNEKYNEYFKHNLAEFDKIRSALAALNYPVDVFEKEAFSSVRQARKSKLRKLFIRLFKIQGKTI